MTLVFKAGALRTALARAGHAIERGSTIPVLSCVRFDPAPEGERGERRVAISATNLDHWLQLTVPCSGEMPMALVVPLVPLLRIVSGIAAEEMIRLTVLPGDKSAKGKAAPAPRLMIDLPDGRASLICLDPADWPQPSGVEWTGAFRLPRAGLLDLLPFVSREETRYFLNGVALEFGAAGITAIATDGHRLGHHIIAPRPNETRLDGKTIIVPHEALTALKRVQIGDDLTVRVGFGRTHIPARNGGTLGDVTDAAWVEFIGEGGTFAARLIYGDFPDWRRIALPGAGEKLITGEVERAGLAARARRLSGWRDSGRLAKLMLKGSPDGAVTMTAHLPDIGTVTLAAPLRIAADKPWAVGMNAGYLSEVLAFLKEERVSFGFRANGGVPSGHDPILFSAGTRHAVLMPMLISNADVALGLPEGLAA